MKNAILSILLLEEDQDYAEVLMRLVIKRGHKIHWVETVKAFTECLLPSQQYDLILMDLKLEGETSLKTIKIAREYCPQAKILMVTGYASIATTVEAIKQGADDYLPKPVTVDDILAFYYQNQDCRPNIEEKPLSPKRLEWEYIQRVLQDNDGNISRTAEQLNMHRRTLQRKLQKRPTRE